MKKKSSLLITTLLVSSFCVGVQSEAVAAPTGAVTFTDSGTTLAASGQSIVNGVLELTANINLLPSEIESALATSNLEIRATGITILSNIDVPSNKSLTLKSMNNIQINPGINVTSQSGNITFWSDSDGTSGGAIRMGDPTSNLRCQVSSSGGDISLGGGINYLTDFASGGSSALLGSKPIFGIGIWGCEVNAAGGNISLRGSTGNSAGTNSVRAIIIENNSNSSASGKTSLVTSGQGTVSVYGDASQSSSGTNPWGPTGNFDVTTVNGDITISGKSFNASGTNRRGLAIGNFSFSSTTGDVLIEDQTPGTSSNYSGSYLNGTGSISTSGSIDLVTDKFNGSWFSSYTVSTGPVSIRPYSSTFGMSFTLGPINASNAQSLTIGSSTNTSAITLGNSTTVGGPLSIYGSSIAINSTLSSTALNLTSSGNTTQTGAVTSNALSLQGTGNFTLTNTSNNFASLAGGSSVNRIGGLSLVDSSGGLEVSSSGSNVGIHSSSTVEIATLSGNLSISQKISSSASSGDSIKLYADKDSGTEVAGDGNLVFTGSGLIEIENGARSLLYSGTKSSSSGLGCIVNSDNTRMGVDSTTVVSSINPSINSTGVYALFRVTDTTALNCSSSQTDIAPNVANGYRADEIGNVYFAPYSSRLTNTAKNQIKLMIDSNPAAIYKVTGFVQGVRKTKSGEKLSVARAKAVQDYLVTLGANVHFTVVIESGNIPLENSLGKKSRRATIFVMTPVTL